MPVHLRHGLADTVVPASIGRYYAARIPGIDAVFSEGDGHFSIVLNHAHDLAARLVRHIRA